MLSSGSVEIVLLCSHLGLVKGSELVPLNRREWNLLEQKIQSSEVEGVQKLPEMTAQEIQATFAISEEEAERIARLLGRHDSLTSELERLKALGIRVITRQDPEYPERYRQRLKESAPVILFFAGEAALLGQPGIAVVGSRNLDIAGQECASFVGNACGLSGLVLYSGGARGADTISTMAALESRGSAVSVLAEGMEKTIKQRDVQRGLKRGDLCLLTPYSPDAGFSVGGAMGRNRLIYCLADYAIVVASDAEKGGTWSGASEALRFEWLPVFVLEHSLMPEGNRLLIQKGAHPFPHPFPEHYLNLANWLKDHSRKEKSRSTQLGLL